MRRAITSVPHDSGVIVVMVREVMTREVVTIGPETSCADARTLMDERRIRHLPVVAGGRLVGIVSDRDLRSAASRLSDKVADKIMTLGPITVTPDTRVEQAARLMLGARVGALPVVQGGAVVGIISYTDLLRAMVDRIEAAMQDRIAVDYPEAEDA